MKIVKITLLIAVVLLAAAGCVTQTQVKEIVAASNAAMVDVPALPQADSGVVDEAKLNAAIGRIETIIARHPDQTVLVNTLRLRQAMMLTVAHKPQAANIVWSQVKEPTGQRDAALYSLRAELVWWFGAAGNFRDGDIERGKKALVKIETVCDGLPMHTDIRYYFETMHAAIGLAVASKTNTLDASAEVQKRKKREVADQMVANLKRFAEQYEGADRDWIKSNWETAETFPDVPVSVIRARVELRRLLQAYFKQTKVKKLEDAGPVTWQPAWVEAQWQVWKSTP